MDLKGNAIPVQAWAGPWVPGGRGSSQISRQSGHEVGKCFIPTHLSPLSPRKYSWYSFMLEAESTQGHSVTGRVNEKSIDTIGN